MGDLFYKLTSLVTFPDRKPPGVGRGRGRGREEGTGGRQAKGIGRGIDDGGAKGSGGGRGKGGSAGKTGPNKGNLLVLVISIMEEGSTTSDLN